MACGRLLDLVQPEVDLFDPQTPKTLPTVGLPRTYPLWRYHHSKFSKWEVCGSSVGCQLYTYSTLHFRNVAREQEAKLPLGQPNVLPHSTFGVTWRHRWRDHLIPYISYWWSFGTKPLSLSVSDILNIECNAMLDMTLIRPLNKYKCQGHSFWYQSISHIRLPIMSILL